MPTHELPKRRRPANGVFISRRSKTVVFDTVCIRKGANLLATPIRHRMLLKAWNSAPEWEVGRYVVMPDHVHYFAWYTGADCDLDRWVRKWKSAYTRNACVTPRGWLPGHWDTRMRTVDQYEEKWKYVRQNPVRAGLVEHADDWPFAGEANKIHWD